MSRRGVRRPLVAGIGILLVASLVATTPGVVADVAGSAGFTESRADFSDPGDRARVGVDVRVKRHNATTVAYSYRFDVPPGTDELSVRFHQGHVARSSGFETTAAPRLLEWGGRSDPTATLLQRVDRSSGRRCVCAATERWVVVRPVRVELVTTAASQRTRSYLTNWLGERTADTTVTVTDGTFTPGVLYLGPTRESTARGPGGRDIRVIAPDGPRQPAATRVRSALVGGADLVDFTAGEDRPATLVVVPHTERAVVGDGPNLLDVRGIVWSGGYAFVDGNTSAETWLHEYVHTQERYSTERSMRWYTEATAEYYGDLLSARVAGGTHRDVAATYSQRATESSVLADPDTWASERVPYRRGARVVAYLDSRIREETDGAATFADVYRRLNGREDLTVADLLAATRDVVGDDALTAEVDRYVRSTARPEDDWAGSSGGSDSAAPAEGSASDAGAGGNATGEGGAGVDAGPGTNAGSEDIPRPGASAAVVSYLVALLSAVLAVQRRS